MTVVARKIISLVEDWPDDAIRTVKRLQERVSELEATLAERDEGDDPENLACLGAPYGLTPQEAFLARLIAKRGPITSTCAARALDRRRRETLNNPENQVSVLLWRIRGKLPERYAIPRQRGGRRPAAYRMDNAAEFLREFPA